MRYDQRLLLAFTLTLGLMLLWSWLFPPIRTTPGRSAPPQQLLSQEDVSVGLSEQPAAEQVIPFSLGSFALGVGETTGALKRIEAGGSRILDDSKSVLFQVDLLSPSPISLDFRTGLEGESLIGQAEIPQAGLVAKRRITPVGKNQNSLLLLNLEISNRSAEGKAVQPRISVYRPVYSMSPEEQRYREGRVSVDGVVQKIRGEGDKRGSQRFTGATNWITSQGRASVVIVQPLAPPGAVFHVEQSPATGVTGWLEFPAVKLLPGASQGWTLQVYAGPLSLASLNQVGMEDKISFGLFSGITKLLFGILNWSKGWLHSYGLAILFVSFGIWLLFFPITWSGVRMMRVMGQLQPQMERIRNEHRKNPQKMNQEILQLYRKHRVNPLTGCLPLFLQTPIFIALYHVLYRSPELQGAGFLWIRDLSAPDALVRFSSPVPLLGGSLNLLPILMAGGMFLQQRMTQKSQMALTEEQAMQQKIFQWFPLLFSFMFYGLPSGLVLYWVCNTVLSVAQQLVAVRLLKG